MFLDTPGIHKPRHKLGEYMVKVAQATLEEVDIILYVVDATVPPGSGEEYILSQLSKVKTPVILVLNKIDLVKKHEILPVIEWFSTRADFLAAVPISALTGENFSELRRVVIDNLPEGHFYYPAEMVTDQPEHFVASEIVREKVLALTREEIPHSVAVAVEEMKMRPNNVLYISCVIYVERDSQKGILIGKGGQMLKEVGRLARLDLEAIFGNQVYLDLWVKVKKDWRDDEIALRTFGYK